MKRFYLANQRGLLMQSPYSAEDVRKCVAGSYWPLTSAFFVPESDTRIKHFRRIIHDPETCRKITDLKHLPKET